MAGIGILGGTFDPVHHAHLAMARAALRALALEKIRFIPTGTTRYRKPAVASGEHRVAMLRLALRDEPQCEIDTRELRPGASGYTADTLRELRAEGLGPLYLLIGADQYEKLDTWHCPDEVRRLARIAVFARPGIKLNLEENATLIPMQPLSISASEVRARAARGEDLRAFVPPAVAQYIERHGLYA